MTTAIPFGDRLRNCLERAGRIEQFSPASHAFAESYVALFMLF